MQGASAQAALRTGLVLLDRNHRENIKEAGQLPCAPAALSSPSSVIELAEMPTEFFLDRRHKRVSFASEPTFFTIDRRPYTDIVGDIRDPHNPNFCAIGFSRSLRLSQFAVEHLDLVVESWFRALKREAKRSQRARASARRRDAEPSAAP